jgi:polar amino acid transport system substrate-binding protein
MEIMFSLRICLVASLAAVVAVPAGRAQDAASVWRDIDIASEGARPPYNFMDPNGELAGFEIDLGHELCRRMKARCRFVSQDWDSLIPNLLAGQYDAVMAALEITDERLQKIAFSKPYLRMPQAFATARDRDLRGVDPDALAGHSIGVEADSTHQAYLEAIYPKSEIKTYGELQDAMLDMAEGRVDTVFGDKDAIVDFLDHRREAQCCSLLGDAPAAPAFFGEGIGIGLRQTDGSLKQAFDKALNDVTADGTYARLRAKYWNFPVR